VVFKPNITAAIVAVILDSIPALSIADSVSPVIHAFTVRKSHPIGRIAVIRVISVLYRVEFALLIRCFFHKMPP
jgi:hypothetical protein